MFFFLLFFTIKINVLLTVYHSRIVYKNGGFLRSAVYINSTVYGCNLFKILCLLLAQTTGCYKKMPIKTYLKPNN